MLNPDLRGLLKNNLSRYSLVIAAARVARDIVDEQEKKDRTPSDEKPLSTAINLLLKSEKSISEPEEIRDL
ncbi:MAG: DNA-directed RNA polymerase subunit omega [Oscillospiraceae bacterium]|nr:DNA-directed RNA polymerase subunit omega [Oscillospiraceae bacterium]